MLSSACQQNFSIYCAAIACCDGRGRVFSGWVHTELTIHISTIHNIFLYHSLRTGEGICGECVSSLSYSQLTSTNHHAAVLCMGFFHHSSVLCMVFFSTMFTFCFFISCYLHCADARYWFLLFRIWPIGETGRLFQRDTQWGINEKEEKVISSAQI